MSEVIENVEIIEFTENTDVIEFIEGGNHTFNVTTLADFSTINGLATDNVSLKQELDKLRLDAFGYSLIFGGL